MTDKLAAMLAFVESGAVHANLTVDEVRSRAWMEACKMMAGQERSAIMDRLAAVDVKDYRAAKRDRKQA